MKLIKPVFLISAIFIFASCTKLQHKDLEIKEGMLQRQGATTYQYGTHILEVNATTRLVLESHTVSLDKYIGKQVKISAVADHGPHVENGPDIYYVVAIWKTK